jgi:hypothetical protein
MQQHSHKDLTCSHSTLYILPSEAMKEGETRTLNTPTLIRLSLILQSEVSLAKMIVILFRQENSRERG